MEQLKQVYVELRSEIFDALDAATLAETSNSELSNQLKETVNLLIEKRKMTVSSAQRSEIVKALLDELKGLGPLQSLLENDHISDIMINGPSDIFIEIAGKVQKSEIQFVNEKQLKKLSFQQRHAFAKEEMLEIFGRVWKWVIIGVGAGAALHGFVPDGWIEHHLGDGQWWSVPAAVLLGIPLYSNATGVIPIMESLINNGLPVGTTLAFCMSTVAASFPEFILLKQVMQWKLLATVFLLLLVSFTIVGWIFNALSSFL